MQLRRASDGAHYSASERSAATSTLTCSPAAREIVHQCQSGVFAPAVVCRWKSTLTTEGRESATARDLHVGLRMSVRIVVAGPFCEFRVLVVPTMVAQQEVRQIAAPSAVTPRAVSGKKPAIPWRLSPRAKCWRLRWVASAGDYRVSTRG